MKKILLILFLFSYLFCDFSSLDPISDLKSSKYYRSFYTYSITNTQTCWVLILVGAYPIVYTPTYYTLNEGTATNITIDSYLYENIKLSSTNYPFQTNGDCVSLAFNSVNVRTNTFISTWQPIATNFGVTNMATVKTIMLRSMWQNTRVHSIQPIVLKATNYYLLMFTNNSGQSPANYFIGIEMDFQR